MSSANTALASSAPPVSTSDTHNIPWPCLSVVSSATEQRLYSVLIRKGEWGSHTTLSAPRLEEIARAVEAEDITLVQARSLRRGLLRKRAMKREKDLRATSTRVLYDRGVSVPDLARDWDFPPVNTMRAILKARQWDKAKVKAALQSPDTLLSTRDAREFRQAEAVDVVSKADQTAKAEKARLFEEVLRDHFSQLGVSYRVESDLIQEQKAASPDGTVTATPDLLLLDPVTINGHPVHWVDAKCFYGADLPLPKKSAQKQAARYTKHFGPGAIVYMRGFCDALDVPGALLLDATPLDLSRME
ncbi:protein of unknown function with TPD sequence-motif [Kipferlia bialata]|uniref:CDAN1-interacting nuclease 1 n=1 Tax=Kipferlia bialata TaxID=797122 RepID=A0A9K3CUI1_9EUKA|nr:protein of unknown function with TPD sequence-motif [Kipferlia bialata]|eukprot:g3730.t1